MCRSQSYSIQFNPIFQFLRIFAWQAAFDAAAVDKAVAILQNRDFRSTEFQLLQDPGLDIQVQMFDDSDKKLLRCMKCVVELFNGQFVSLLSS